MKTTKILFWAFTFAAMLQGCNLDREPADYIDYGVSFNNMQDAAKWDNGIYSTLRGKFGGGYVLPQEAQADCLTHMRPSETFMASSMDGPFCPKAT